MTIHHSCYSSGYFQREFGLRPNDIREGRFCPVVPPAAFLDEICWILVGDRYHLWCIYTYCSNLFYPPRISLPFFICSVFPSISSFIKMCIFRKGVPVFLSPYISVIQKVKSAEIFLYFDFKVPAWRNRKLSLRYYFPKHIGKISYLSPIRGDLANNPCLDPSYIYFFLDLKEEVHTFNMGDEYLEAGGILIFEVLCDILAFWDSYI